VAFHQFPRSNNANFRNSGIFYRKAVFPSAGGVMHHINPNLIWHNFVNFGGDIEILMLNDNVQ
jgi:hypothetical protein